MSPNRVSPPSGEVPPLCDSMFLTDNNDGQLEEVAPVFCHFEVCYAHSWSVKLRTHLRQVGKPTNLRIPIKNDCFSFIEDCDFLSEAEFIKRPFEIDDILMGRFMPIPPSSFWHYPSPRNPFFIIKGGRIEEEECQNLQDLISSLSDGDHTDFETGPQMRLSSSFAPSLPPPAQPFYPRESPIRVKFDEKGVQTIEGAQPRKRKRSNFEFEADVPAPKASFKLSLHIDGHGKGKHPSKKGTGNSIADPIII